MTQHFDAMQSDERAVSELIGYAILFSVILATVIFVSLASGPIIETQQSQQSAIAAEEMFKQIDSDVNAVQHGAEYKTREMQLPAGQYLQGERTEITIEQDGVEEMEMSIVPIEYTASDNSKVVYTGAFTAHSPSGGTVDDAHVREARSGYLTEQNPVFTIPELDHPEEISTFSSSQRAATVQFDMGKEDPDGTAEVQTFHEADGEVEFTVNSPHAAAWEDYFDEHAAITTDRDEGEEEFTFTFDFDEIDSDRVTVTSEHIVVEFSR